MKELTEQKEKKGVARHPFLFLLRGMIFLLLFDVSFFEVFDPLLICAIFIQIFSKKEGFILNFIKAYSKALWYPERLPKIFSQKICYFFLKGSPNLGKSFRKVIFILLLPSFIAIILLIVFVLIFSYT
ncbi:hypothetical protein FAI41_02590 [Acetobacteraceae bacterium]|nr:hypothetical protein FAI41_02590 [Acetobacteraceae bacterium]